MAPTLNTQHLIIRPFTSADLPAFARYRAIPSIAKYQSWHEYHLDDAIALFESTHYDAFGAAEQWFQLAIIDKHTQQLAGDVAVHFIDEHQVEIGFTIAPQFQRLGIAKTAVRCVLTYLFNAMNKHRVIAITDVRNDASCGLLRALGFRQEAHFIKNVFFKGEWGDEYLFAILQSEFSDAHTVSC
ncbi:GNAT family N-acetyltransferase [Flocculibacter collagenilyticus]|uniref:GNAT family N-acetyltransferase n=1 Tax=Flocculibacter collagenilyticus TaxID=2744479 RepID=UPI0018F4A742|nr:GNAT family protein [Flocculibacter collagenilyticus]